jgi:hypothetical protein
MLDTNVFDRVEAEPGLEPLLHRLIGEGALDVVVCHVQNDEIAAIPDPDRRRALERTPRRTVPSSVFVFDVSRFGMARLGEPEFRGVDYDAIAGPGRRHARDAVIARTAAEEADVLVTEERRLANALAGKPLPVWTFAEFRDWLLRTSG